MSKSNQLPKNWERLNRDGRGNPAYHNPAEDPAPFVKIYTVRDNVEDYEFEVVAYPEGSDLAEDVVVGGEDTVEEAEQLAKEWIINNSE